MPFDGLLDTITDLVNEVWHGHQCVEHPYDDAVSIISSTRQIRHKTNSHVAFLDAGSKASSKVSLFFPASLSRRRYCEDHMHAFLETHGPQLQSLPAQFRKHVFTNFSTGSLLPPEPFEQTIVRRHCPQYVLGPDHQLHDCGPDERGRLVEMERDCLLTGKDFGRLVEKALFYRANHPVDPTERYYSINEHEKLKKRMISSGGDFKDGDDPQKRRAMTPQEQAMAKAKKKMDKAESKRQQKETRRQIKNQIREEKRQHKWFDKELKRMMKEDASKKGLDEAAQRKRIEKEVKRQGRAKEKENKRMAAAAEKNAAAAAENAAANAAALVRVQDELVMRQIKKEMAARGGSTLPTSGVMAEIKNPFMHMKCVQTKFGAAIWRTRECNTGTHEWQLYCNRGGEMEMPDTGLMPKFEEITKEGKELDNGLCNGQLSIQCMPKKEKASY
eukprot:gnl/MRDRNA2_/MRDRNA2_93315_c0_seq1.p1 gnl/MRDRNA2_/MRDRNA2_93315_c0~~gnl/MRDRNA2_/MRDRNA2_93315_c0_seq1.p1  ORF type:complete len:444 (+),score=97.47 gnl/MRDRNA2_/MRDRNA2_93315_c0_seq1:138-1469(+)